MSIVNVKEQAHLISNFSRTRQIMTEIKRVYGINRGELEILCTCYDVQEPKQPYFFIPDVVKRLPTINKSSTYKYIKQLERKGYLKLSLVTPKAFTPNYYIITGNGESILRNYIDQLYMLVEQ